MTENIFLLSESRRGDDSCQSHPCLHSGAIVNRKLSNYQIEDDDYDGDANEDNDYNYIRFQGSALL